MVFVLTHKDQKGEGGSLASIVDKTAELISTKLSEADGDLKERVITVGFKGESREIEDYDCSAFESWFSSFRKAHIDQARADRKRAGYHSLAVELHSLLKEKRRCATLSDPELDERSRELAIELQGIETGLAEANQRLDSVGRRCAETVKDIMELYIPQFEGAEKETLPGISKDFVESLTTSIKQVVESEFADFSLPNLDHVGATIASQIQAVIKQVGAGKSIGTAVLASVVLPGASVGANVLEGLGGAASSAAGKKAVKKAVEKTATEGLKRFGLTVLAGAGEFIKEVNPVELVGDYVETKWKGKAVAESMKQLEFTVSKQVKSHLEARFCQSVFGPIIVNRRALQSQIDESRHAQSDSIRSLRNGMDQLDQDIRILNEIVDQLGKKL